VVEAFNSSPDFELSSGDRPGSLVVTIPTNVDWKEIGKRTRVMYKVEFTSTENSLLERDLLGRGVPILRKSGYQIC
jgi:hypothetical protein